MTVRRARHWARQPLYLEGGRCLLHWRKHGTHEVISTLGHRVKFLIDGKRDEFMRAFKRARREALKCEE